MFKIFKINDCVDVDFLLSYYNLFIILFYVGWYEKIILIDGNFDVDNGGMTPLKKKIILTNTFIKITLSYYNEEKAETTCYHFIAGSLTAHN